MNTREFSAVPSGEDTAAPPNNAPISASGKFVSHAVGTFKSSVKNTKRNTKEFAQEIKAECFEVFEVYESINFIRENWYKFIFVPYLPAFHRPGWLLRYVVGPHTWDLFFTLFSDFWAGITVALTLIPQVCFTI